MKVGLDPFEIARAGQAKPVEMRRGAWWFKTKVRF
jgi:hypothetical protein